MEPGSEEKLSYQTVRDNGILPRYSSQCFNLLFRYGSSVISDIRLYSTVVTRFLLRDAVGTTSLHGMARHQQPPTNQPAQVAPTTLLSKGKQTVR